MRTYRAMVDVALISSYFQTGFSLAQQIDDHLASFSQESFEKQNFESEIHIYCQQAYNTGLISGNIEAVQPTDLEELTVTTRMSHYITRLYSENEEEPNAWKTQAKVAQLINSEICTISKGLVHQIWIRANQESGYMEV